MRLAEYCAVLIGAPLVGVVVMVFSGADAAGTLPGAASRWERILERGWAIVVLDAGISFIQTLGLQATAQGDALNAILGMFALFLTAMLVYAEPFACLDAGVRPFSLIPFALMRSMMLAWVNVSRVFSLFAIELALSIVDLGIVQIHGLGGAAAGQWFDLAFWTFATAPLATLFTVAYLDTLAQERSTTR